MQKITRNQRQYSASRGDNFACEPLDPKRKGVTRGLAERIIWRPRTSLKRFPGNPRRHGDAQIVRLVKSIQHNGWTIPILTDEAGMILAGHARDEAAERLGMTDVPTIMISGLSDAEKRALVIADNRLAEQAEWDLDLLKENFKDLIDIDFDIELTGFDTGEVDLLLDGGAPPTNTDPADNVDSFTLDGPAVSRVGDVWTLGRHRLVCGDALKRPPYAHLMQRDVAQMVVTDPPYNVPIAGHAMGRGKIHHREFKQAAGEMSAEEFAKFLASAIRLLLSFSGDGSIHYIFMDWRHLLELLNAAKPLYSEWKNLLVWNKNNAGQGSFYRSKHELILVFKNGTAPHVNNFSLGANGRYRANVIDCPSVNCLHPARRGDLALHPTVKPVALIADLIRDCSKRNGTVLDAFGGSGTTILAAERTGRIARVIELDPLYVDVAIRRWEAITGIQVLHAKTGLSFADIATKRGADHDIDAD